MKFCLLTLVLFIHHRVNCQELTTTHNKLLCEYKLTYKPDSTIEATKHELFILAIDNGLSIFKSVSGISRDSLTDAYSKVPFTQENMQLMLGDLNKIPKTNFNYSIYKTVASKAVTYYEQVGRNKYTYQEPTNSLSWNVINEIATITGYKCQKATTEFGGRIFEAWFTREIPIAEGPYKFYGLPGLIVKINDNRNFYIFSLISLKQSIALQPIIMPSQATKTTKEEFSKGKAAYAAGALDRVAAMGNTITESDRQQFKERAKKRNNPLELK